MTKEQTMIKQYYGTLTKSLNNEANNDYLYVEGFASTSSKDLEGDIILSKGLNLQVPVKLLAHHNKSQPIGDVYDAVHKEKGLYIQAKIPLNTNIDYVNLITKQIQAGLVSGFSVGVIINKSLDIPSGKLVHSADVFEVSCVALPANKEATITLVRSLFNEQEEASSIDNLMRIKELKTKVASVVLGATRLLKGK